jgi:ABC-type sugar transport system substrate-binding protein
MNPGRLAALVLTLAALTFGVAACGGDDDGDNASNGNGGSQASGSSASGGGGDGEIGGKTVGFVNIVANEASQKAEDSFREAAEILDWEVVSGSRAEDVITAEQSVQNLVNRNVDAIVMQSVDPASLGDALNSANRKNIPVIAQENGSGYAYLYNDSVLAMPDWDFAAQGSMIANFFVRKVLEKSGGEKAQVIVFTGLPSLPSQQLWVGALRNILKQNPQIEVVAEHSVDYTKPGEDIASFLDQQLQANPDVTGIFTAANLEAPATASAVDAAGKTGDIVITTLFGDSDLLELLRQEKLTGLVDVPVDKGSWQSADALVSHFAGEEVDKNASLTDPLQPRIIDQGNVPPEGQPVKYPPFKPGFEQKWCDEFDVEAACN